MSKTKVFLVFLLFLCFRAPAQTSTSTAADAASANMVSTSFDMSGFPQWSKDLRRGEIVAFGSFPFAFFFTNMVYDTYRCASNGWDTRYAPWPVKSAGAVGLTQKEQLTTLGIAAGTAVAIAIIDHIIVRYKRNKMEQEIKNLPAGTPIINRRPLGAGTEETPQEAGTEYSAAQDDTGAAGSDPLPAGEAEIP